MLFSEQLSVTCRTVAEECCASLNITSAASQEVSKVLLSVTCEVLLSVNIQDMLDTDNSTLYQAGARESLGVYTAIGMVNGRHVYQKMG